MITRRTLLSATGMLAASGSFAAQTGALSQLSSASHKSRPIVFVSDHKVSKLGLAAPLYRAVQGASLSPVTPKALPQGMASHLAQGVEWLASHRGSSVIFAVDAGYGFFLDELAKESRARTLFRGEHYALGVNQGPVSHQVVELPVSAGVASQLPENGAWTDPLMTALAKVANRVWLPPSMEAPIAPSTNLRSASAELALATYVLDI